MIGGWESFHGWEVSGTGLPSARFFGRDAVDDDRVNCDSPVFVRTSENQSPDLRSLPLDVSAPADRRLQPFSERGPGPHSF